MTEAEVNAEILELLFTRAEARGDDMTAMRRVAGQVAAMETGDPTPLPGALMRQALAKTTVLTLEPLHEGPNETRESKFYQHHSGLLLPRFGDGSRRHRASTHKRLDRHGSSLTLLWFCFLVVLAVGVHAWRPGWP